MKHIKLMRVKLHRVRVTSTNLNYMGSITIDEELLEKVGLLPLEEVEIVNITNGNRWATYILPGKADNGEVCPNGGGAYLCKTGDILIIYAYSYQNSKRILRKGYEAKILVADKNNECKDFFVQKIKKKKGKIRFKNINRKNKK